MTQYSSIKTVQKLSNKTAANVFHRFDLVITEEESSGLQCFLLLVRFKDFALFTFSKYKNMFDFSVQAIIMIFGLT